MLLKLFINNGFNTYFHNTSSIHTYYYIIKNKLIHLRHNCKEFDAKKKGEDDIIMIDNNQYYK